MGTRSSVSIAMACAAGSVLLIATFSTWASKRVPTLPIKTRYERTISPAQDESLVHARLALKVPAGAVTRPMRISIESLVAEQVPRLDPGMINLTPDQGAFRLTPHGLTFTKPAEIILPYDPTILHAGLSLDDVQVFYYDEEAGRWRILPRRRVDDREHLVISTTTHFTDFIAGIVTVPDHPQTLAYAPTAISELQAAVPGAEINLIDPPQANSFGDAQLVYPIQLPPGLAGMQPSVGLHYSSSRGNGWVGMGWELPIQAITIETRWGVPRYDQANETETYLLDGQMLAPVAHRESAQPRRSEKEFHARVEGAFRKIIRHGDHPTNYWWEVVTTRGMRSLYGAARTSHSALPVEPGDRNHRGQKDAQFRNGQPEGQASLSNDSGDVFLWALREVRDTHGNSVKYEYERVTDAGIIGGTVEGTQLYLKSIAYTGTSTATGPYKVTFVRDSQLPGYTRRPDVTIDCRGGFKMVTAELLRHIEVSFQDQPIRRYELAYRPGAFGKTLLASITQHGADGTVFHTHTFEYYDEIRDAGGQYAGFAARESWNTQDDHVGLVELQALGHGNTTALSGTSGVGGGGPGGMVRSVAHPRKKGKFGYVICHVRPQLSLVSQ